MNIEFGSNVFTAVPWDALQDLNETLTVLKLDNNIFTELGTSSESGLFNYVPSGKDTFPLMTKLIELNLDDCRIQGSAKDCDLGCVNSFGGQKESRNLTRVNFFAPFRTAHSHEGVSQLEVAAGSLAEVQLPLYDPGRRGGRSEPEHVLFRRRRWSF